MDATALTAPSDSGDDRHGEARREPSDEQFRRALGELEAAILAACETHEEWPRRVAAGLDAAVDFVVTSPDALDLRGTKAAPQGNFAGSYEFLINRLAALFRRDAPLTERLPASTDEAVVGGIVGLVGDHVRIGHFDRLLELKPDLVLLALLPYLGFVEAREWANRLAGENLD